MKIHDIKDLDKKSFEDFFLFGETYIAGTDPCYPCLVKQPWGSYIESGEKFFIPPDRKPYENT